MKKGTKKKKDKRRITKLEMALDVEMGESFGDRFTPGGE